MEIKLLQLQSYNIPEGLKRTQVKLLLHWSNSHLPVRRPKYLPFFISKATWIPQKYTWKSGTIVQNISQIKLTRQTSTLWIQMRHVQCGCNMHINIVYTYLTSAIIFGATITKEVSILGISYIMSTMTYTSTNRADTNTIYHFASMTMVPMLIHEFSLCYCEGTEFVTETVLILKLRTMLQFK